MTVVASGDSRILHMHETTILLSSHSSSSLDAESVDNRFLLQYSWFLQPRQCLYAAVMMERCSLQETFIGKAKRCY
jgi:hypothetical protein